MTPNSDAKFEEEPTCRCKNDMRNLANFHASTQKPSNLHFDGFFVQSVLMYEQKITEEFCVTTLKNDAKIEVVLICHLKNDIKKSVNIDLKHLK